MQGGFQMGEWRVEPTASRLVSSRVPDQQIRIDPKAMQVLVYMAEHAGEVVPKTEVVEAVWEGLASSNEVVTNSIWEIRKAVGDDAKRPRYIQTVPRKGYRLVAAVSPSENPPPENNHREKSYFWRKVGELLATARTDLPQRLPSARTVAVLPFTFRGSETFSYLGDSLADLMSASMDASGELVSVDPLRLLELIRSTGNGVDSSRKARRIARQLGSELYVQGDVVEVDGHLHLRALLYSVDDRSGPMARASVQGDREELFQMVEQLTSRLLASRHPDAEAENSLIRSR